MALAADLLAVALAADAGSAADSLVADAGSAAGLLAADSLAVALAADSLAVALAADAGTSADSSSADSLVAPLALLSADAGTAAGSRAANSTGLTRDSGLGSRVALICSNLSIKFLISSMSLVKRSSFCKVFFALDAIVSLISILEL